jgi:hypothetical protein
MLLKKPNVDVVQDILNETHAAHPTSEFVKSLMLHYEKWGTLSKKQMEGLHSKASKIASIAPNKLATMEAILLKMPDRFKSKPRFPTPLYKKNEAAEELILDILFKYPSHKRVLFLKAKQDGNEVLTPADLTELEKFHRLLVKSKQD